MAFSTACFPSCTARTHSSLLSVPNPFSLTPAATSFSPHQATHKLRLYQPHTLKMNNPYPPIMIMNPRRSSSSSSASGFRVNALRDEEKRYKNVEVFSKEHLAVSLAHDIYNLSMKYIQERGTFFVALSGGPSVKYLTKLVEPPYVDAIDWSKWYFFWVDEQTLNPSDSMKQASRPFGDEPLILPTSHELADEIQHRRAFDKFLSKVPLPHDKLNITTIYDPSKSAKELADLYEKRLQHLLLQYNTNLKVPLLDQGLPKFDLMVLDMGPDGRVGSLLPNHPDLNNTKRWVTVMREKTKLQPPRITMTPLVVNSASNIAMVVAGASKRNAIYSALKEDCRRADHRVPAKLISPSEGKLKWYLDKAAASKLFGPEIHMEERY